MELLPHGLQLEIPPGCFPLTTDSMALAHFAGSLGAKSVLDLGSGCGTLGLLLCAQSQRCHVTGIELDAAAHRGAEENIRRNKLTERMESICADLRQLPGLFEPGQFDCCISNPPYFSGGPASFFPQPPAGGLLLPGGFDGFRRLGAEIWRGFLSGASAGAAGRGDCPGCRAPSGSQAAEIAASPGGRPHQSDSTPPSQRRTAGAGHGGIIPSSWRRFPHKGIP